MNTAQQQQYLSFLNDPSIFNSVNNKGFDHTLYLSFLNSTHVASFFTKKKENPVIAAENLFANKAKVSHSSVEKTISVKPKEMKKKIRDVAVETPKPSPVVPSDPQYVRNERVVELYSRDALTAYPNFYNKDNIDSLGVYFRKLINVDANSIISWAENELSDVAEITREVTRVSAKYADLRAYDVLIKSLDDLRKKPSLWDKVTNSTNQFTKTSTLLESINKSLVIISEEIMGMISRAEKVTRKIELMYHSFDIVAKILIAESSPLSIHLYSKTETLYNSYLQSMMILENIKALSNDCITVKLKIEEALSFTIPTLQMTRNHNV